MGSELICLKISFWLLGRQEHRRGFSEIRQSRGFEVGEKHSVETGFWRPVPLLPCHQRGDADLLTSETPENSDLSGQSVCYQRRAALTTFL